MKTLFLRMIIAIGFALEVAVVLGDPDSLKLEISVKAAGENASTNYADFTTLCSPKISVQAKPNF